MTTEFPDGDRAYREAYFRGLRPDPDLWIDEWADEYMRIPRDTGAPEPGQYRTDRTPYAREPMRCLSPAHPCRRVVTMVASQLMKTQIALNWMGGLIHMAPSNILALLPSLGLSKRVSGRISKTIKATPELAKRVAASRSRDARNTMDTKEFEGGALYVTTAGSAANLIDHQVIWGDPADERTWAVLDEKLKARYRHPCGVALAILATGVDSGGHHTDEVYQFCRVRRWRNMFALKGASKPGKPVIAQRPSMVDVTWKGQTERGGAELWFVGTDTAKDWIYNRYAFEDGPGSLHFANDLPDEFFAQCVAERKVARYVKGYKRIEWVKGKAERNEALDLMVYCLAMAHYLGINRYQEHDWERVRQSLAQAGLFDEKVVAAERVTVAEQAPATPQVVPQAVAPVAQPRPAAPPQRRSSTSGYLKRR